MGHAVARLREAGLCEGAQVCLAFRSDDPYVAEPYVVGPGGEMTRIGPALAEALGCGYDHERGGIVVLAPRRQAPSMIAYGIKTVMGAPGIRVREV